jgi:hypothetical protein
MGFLSLSDIIISVTLILNAGALLATKPASHEAGTQEEIEKLVDNLEAPSSPSENVTGSNTASVPQSKTSIPDRISYLLYGLRRFSCVLVMWNAVFFILMMFVFGS